MRHEECELVRQPRNRIALAAAGAVLDQIPMSRTRSVHLLHQIIDGLKPMIARENQRPLTRLASVGIFLLDDMDKLLDQVQHAIPRPDSLPEIRRGRPIHGWRIPRAAVLALIERQESCLHSLQMGGHGYQVRINSEMPQTPPKAKRGSFGSRSR